MIAPLAPNPTILGKLALTKSEYCLKAVQRKRRMKLERSNQRAKTHSPFSYSRHFSRASDTSISLTVQCMSSCFSSQAKKSHFQRIDEAKAKDTRQNLRNAYQCGGVFTMGNTNLFQLRLVLNSLKHLNRGGSKVRMLLEEPKIASGRIVRDGKGAETA
jgi:hypothetical protein